MTPKLTPAETDRLADIATTWRDARQAAKDRTKALQDAVISAIDQAGASTREVAAAIGVSQSRVYAIIRAGYTG